jgi:hypothetical protein
MNALWRAVLDKHTHERCAILDGFIMKKSDASNLMRGHKDCGCGWSETNLPLSGLGMVGSLRQKECSKPTFAQRTKDIYDALMAVGFKEHQALELVKQLVADVYRDAMPQLQEGDS